VIVAKPKRPPTALLEAAEAFDDALHDYTQLAELLLRTPLTSSKHLERVRDILAEIAGNEERLAACGKTLAEQVAASRDRQEQLAQQMIQRLPEVKERMEKLRDLHVRLETLGTDGGQLSRDTAAAGRDRPAQKDIAARMRALADRAAEIAKDAHALDFEEVAQRAHALAQQLASATRKLENAG
jgi:hypothetical protein